MNIKNTMGGGVTYTTSSFRKEGKAYLIALLNTSVKGGVCV